MAEHRTRCAIYTRKSTEEGLDQHFNSLQAQREACEAYIRSQKGEGWSVVHASYDDGGYSGGNLQRPALQRLLADIDKGLVDVVVVYKVDRLTRSLSDFARIVERLEAKGSSFVSVTQAFNTTTSMGRLTLNVLLSFAQFEREVTGERIRDKIAASKAKGMWMGGALPLGYDAPTNPATRALVVNETEAELVRLVFMRYLVLRSIPALCDWLNAQGYQSKAQTSRAGNVRGGGPFGRGALFHLLSNRTYLGQIPHRQQSYPGAHPSIVDVALFDEVQHVLKIKTGDRGQTGFRVGKAPLSGRVCDEQGRRMQATFTCRGARQYRYYAVPVPKRGGQDALASVSAPLLEKLLFQRLVRICAAPVDASGWASLLPFLKQVRVSRSRVQVVLDGAAVLSSLSSEAELQARLAPRLIGDERLEVRGTEAIITIEAAPKVRGGRTWLVGQGGRGVEPTNRADDALARALRSAHERLRQYRSGAAQRPIESTYERRLLSLAMMAPDIQRAILLGRHPPELTLDRLMSMHLPLSWPAQRQALGF